MNAERAQNPSGQPGQPDRSGQSRQLDRPDRAGQPASSRDRLAAIRTRTLLELTALAEDAAAHLRRHASPAVRVSAALLLTASLAAACAPETAPPPELRDGGNPASPLRQDVAGGLPTQSGRYDVQKDSIARDRKGIYEFTWLDEQKQPHNAYVSRLRLAQEPEGSELKLEMPPDRSDPILHLPSDVPVRIVEESLAAQTQSDTYVRHSYPYHSDWLPFAAGAVLGRLSAPSYYNPPLGNYNVGTRITGGTASTTPPPPESRVIGLRSAVSGQAGGSGAGSAVTGKVGAPTGGSTGGAGRDGAPAPATGPGTGSGQAGGTGSGSAVTGKVGASGGSGSSTGSSGGASGGSSGSGVTSPSSGGFSGGKGSVGGGSSGGGSSS